MVHLVIKHELVTYINFIIALHLYWWTQSWFIMIYALGQSKYCQLSALTPTFQNPFKFFHWRRFDRKLFG